jgi:hypothetical protein
VVIHHVACLCATAVSLQTGHSAGEGCLALLVFYIPTPPAYALAVVKSLDPGNRQRVRTLQVGGGVWYSRVGTGSDSCRWGMQTLRVVCVPRQDTRWIRVAVRLGLYRTKTPDIFGVATTLRSSGRATGTIRVRLTAPSPLPGPR